MSIPYKFALTACIKVDCAAFTSLSVALQTLHDRYPFDDAGNYLDTIASLLQRRYGSGRGVVASIALIKQLCVYHLCLTMHSDEAYVNTKRFCIKVVTWIRDKAIQREALRGLYVADFAARFHSKAFVSDDGILL